MNNEKIILSGIKPTASEIHIGNYFGAIKQQVQLQEKGLAFYFIADLHALNSIQDPEVLRKNIRSLALDYIALGLDPEKAVIFQQSKIPEVTELQSILNNVTPIGLLKRAHAYKAVLDKDGSDESVNMGLFSYPILMAADILIYKSDLVPIGEDQLQHLEIARELARRFNSRFGDIFKVPEPLMVEEGARVMGIYGKEKMSKSLNNYISIFRTEDEIKKQVMQCVTDPNRIHKDDPGDPSKGVVFSYLDLYGIDSEDLKQQYREGKVGDIDIKEFLFDTHMNFFKDAREKRLEIERDESYLKNVLEEGSERAREYTKETMIEVRESLGV